MVVADSWEEHLSRLRLLLQKLKEANLTINLSKTSWGQDSVTYLGHTVGSGMVKPKSANIDAILNFPIPQSRKALIKFLGMSGFYWCFCPNFSAVSTPLTSLTSPKVAFVWSPACERAFKHLKSYLLSSLVLRAPDFNAAFHLQVDASGEGVGAVLLQKDSNRDILHPVAFHDRRGSSSPRPVSQTF